MSQFIRLDQYQLIEAHGADAEKYLQGQLTADLITLPSGANTLAAHCDPKGKMNAIFRLLKVDSEQLFSKISFDLRDWQIVGLIGKKCGKIEPRFTLEIDEQRAILLNESALPINFNADEKIWESADIQAGLPNLSAATQNLFIPQALNLQAIEQAISFTKGCYIGQETVARAKYRGANKRAMFILKGKTQTLPAIGDEIEMRLESNWRKTGSIINAVNLDGLLWLLVVLNNDIDPTQVFRLAQDETALAVQPLPYALN